MKNFLLLLLLLPASLFAQVTKNERVLVALTIISDPDETISGQYYLIAARPQAVAIKENQTFLLQSSWQKEGDSVVSIGAGTVKIINDSDVELTATLYPGKSVRKGDIALFLVPLNKPARDTLFFKMARLNIMFKSVMDSSFYNRDEILANADAFPTMKILDAMVADIQYTAKAMIEQGNDQDQEVITGLYKGEKLFDLMRRATIVDVFLFLSYVYAKPDKYKGHDWKVSETFATWVIAGAPTAK